MKRHGLSLSQLCTTPPPQNSYSQPPGHPKYLSTSHIGVVKYQVKGGTQHIFECVGGMNRQVTQTKATPFQENLPKSQFSLSSEISRDPTSCCGWGLTHFWQTDAVLSDDEVINICKYFIQKKVNMDKRKRLPGCAQSQLKASLVLLFKVDGLRPVHTQAALKGTQWMLNLKNRGSM